ncbi:MAG TPA: hypothetical protein VJB11_03065 [archaeon]|nr:hypothetical protein [archaeon]
MYHPGRVVEIFSSSDKNIIANDSSIQVMLEMWDDNLITAQADSHIGKDIKKDDVLLVDYTPTQQNAPKMIAIKILRGEIAKRTWKKYKEHFEKRKMQIPAAKLLPKSGQPYVG